MTNEKEIEIGQRVLRKFYRERELNNEQDFPIPDYVKEIEEFLKKNKVGLYPILGEK